MATYTDTMPAYSRCRSCERQLAPALGTQKVYVRVAAVDPGPPMCQFCGNTLHYHHPPYSRVVT